MPDIAIHRFTTPGMGSVNTYWIETPASIVVIDGQRELSKAQAARAEMVATGKPIVAVFLTHPHPDHFGGLGVFAPEGENVPVHGSRQTRDSIAEDRFGLVAASHKAVGDDFPEQVTLPDHFLVDGQDLTIDGVTFIARELGEGEAECMTALYLPAKRALFCADAVQDRMTAFLLESRSAAWLAQLDRLRAMFPDVVTLYPGHGDPGTPEVLIARQAEYLAAFRGLVEAEPRDGEKDEAADKRIADAMEARFPGYLPVAAIPDLLNQDVGALAKELAAQSNRPSAS